MARESNLEEGFWRVGAVEWRQAPLDGRLDGALWRMITVDRIAALELTTPQATPRKQPSQGLSTTAVIGATMASMLIVAGVWIGLGYAWSSLVPASETTAGAGMHWPMAWHAVTDGFGWNLSMPRQVAIVPEQLARLDLPSVGATFGSLYMVLLEYLIRLFLD